MPKAEAIEARRQLSVPREGYMASQLRQRWQEAQVLLGHAVSTEERIKKMSWPSFSKLFLLQENNHDHLISSCLGQYTIAMGELFIFTKGTKNP